MEPHDLYGLPLDQFTDQRNALAKELRRQGRRDEAAAVAKLRKPSVAAWAVNQLVRTQRRDVGALLEAGDALQRAQADLVGGRGDPSKLRQAVDDERAAVERLVGKARGLLDSDGHALTSPRLEQVTETLHAAALDEDARARVRDGCLDRELRHVGLGSLGATGSETTRRTRRRGEVGGAKAREEEQKRETRRTPASRQEEARASRQEEARASRQERAAKEKAAREAEATARRRLERASRRQSTAERRRERAAAELRDAEQALAAAREVAGEAESDLERAKQLLDEL